MEQNQFPLRLLSGIAIASSLLIGACNNNDTNSSTESTSTTDSSKMIKADTTAAVMPKVDSGAAMPSATASASANGSTTAAATGAAKPNASKKGLKGKVKIMMPTAPRVKADIKPDASGAFANVDYIPSFPGGNAGLQKFFDSNIEYPTSARDEGVEGTVRVAFTVDENGKLMNPVVEGAPQGYGLDAEALRIINKMPMWNPGKINGKPVKTKFVLPVNFTLAGD